MRNSNQRAINLPLFPSETLAASEKLLGNLSSPALRQLSRQTCKPATGLRVVPAKTAAPPAAKADQQALWLAVFLPHIEVQALPWAKGNDDRAAWPRVVSVERQGRLLVASCCPNAQQLGIEPMMTLSAARALSNELQIQPQNPQAEQRLLEAVAACLYAFSSKVCFTAQGLALEVGASLTMFGGIEGLLTQLTKSTQQQEIETQLAFASNTLAASSLARFAPMPGFKNSEAPLASRVGQLPLAAINNPQLEKRLAKLGLTQLSDLIRLPRAGLRKRFGIELLDWLECLLGERPEAIHYWQPPASYQKDYDLEWEVAGFERLQPLLDKALLECSQWLQRRCLWVRELELTFWHLQHPATLVRLQFLQPCNDRKHLARLLAAKLEPVKLPAAVIGCSLVANQLEAQQIDSQGWWSQQSRTGQDWWQLLETLQMRLGQDAVKSLRLVDEHRPERAWKTTLPSIKESSDKHTHNPRPLWLLPQPQPLQYEIRQQLQLLSRPERIHCGWWDEQSINRDYFTARLGSQRLWVFRQTWPTKTGRGSAWFVHGHYD